MGARHGAATLDRRLCCAHATCGRRRLSRRPHPTHARATLSCAVSRVLASCSLCARFVLAVLTFGLRPNLIESPRISSNLLESPRISSNLPPTWCAACARRMERRLADLYVDSLEAADYATFLLDLLWKVTGGHPDGAI